MKYLPFLDKWMPPWLAYHVKIILSALMLSLLTIMFWGGQPLSYAMFISFFFTFLQIEIFMWLGVKFFKYVPGKTPKELTKNILLKLILYFVTVLFIAVSIYIFIVSVEFLSRGVAFSQLSNLIFNREFKTFLVTANVGIMFGILLFFFMLWQQSLKSEFKLKEENLIFQYETLKNQVNPHFLFNSLNTLSSLVSSNPELAEMFIVKFSSIYRYVLEHKDKEFVDLKTEIDFVADYFYLQKIRDEEKIELEIVLELSENYQILPISLQMLVENALKHNVATRKDPLKVRIFMDNDYVVVSNNLQPKTNFESTSKIGLKNLNERLKLVLYKELIVSQTTNDFEVKIPLKRKQASYESTHN